LINSRRRLYMSISAQSDNLGDVEIRNTALRMVASARVPVTIFAGRMPDSYVDAFDLPEGAVVIRSAAAFSLKLSIAVLCGRAHLMLAPGPYVLPQRLGGHTKALGVLLMVVVVRRLGGTVLTVGRAIRGTSRFASLVQRAIARNCSVFTVRDRLSGEVIGVPLELTPDLGLASAGGASNDDVASRSWVALSLRGDRPLGDEWITSLVGEIRASGREPVFVTQVQRDDARHLHWASMTGANVVSWGGESHRAQLSRVRDCYAKSAFIISDRLHGVVFALRYNVFPVVVRRGEPDKLISTLEPFVTMQVLDSQLSPSGQKLSLSPTDADLVTLDEQLRKARTEVAKLEDKIHSFF
jgi:hypothetical protein